ncbi:MAG: alpha/beta hydrolase, partial [Saccharolobus sp.]
MQKLQDKFIEISGAKIHYIEEGNGKPVILFHGARFNARTWEETGT